MFFIIIHVVIFSYIYTIFFQMDYRPRRRRHWGRSWSKADVSFASALVQDCRMSPASTIFSWSVSLFNLLLTFYLHSSFLFTYINVTSFRFQFFLNVIGYDNLKILMKTTVVAESSCFLSIFSIFSMFRDSLQTWVR